jgi:uncharacterized protein YndB with AHSA1/START domain
MSTVTSGTVRVTRNFNAAAERAFDAWIIPDQAGKWLFATPTGEMVRTEIDPHVGGSFIFADRRDGVEVEHVGKYIEFDRPVRLVFRFTVPKYSNVSTRVAIDIKPLASGCELALTHEGVMPDYIERTENGWTTLLEALARELGE